MQAYYETEIEVLDDRRLTIELPDNIPPGQVKLTIEYEAASEVYSARATRKKRMSEFLASLPMNTSGGLSIKEVRARVDEERQSWDD